MSPVMCYISQLMCHMSLTRSLWFYRKDKHTYTRTQKKHKQTFQLIAQFPHHVVSKNSHVMVSTYQDVMIALAGSYGHSLVLKCRVEVPKIANGFFALKQYLEGVDWDFLYEVLYN